MTLELFHGGPSANSLKPLLTLAEKGLAYVDRFINFGKFEQHDPEFVRLNPRGQVPALLHDGRIITESTVICEYLDTVFPDVPLRPADPYWQAQMRIWTKFVDEYFCWCVSTLGWEYGVSKIARAMSEDEFEALVARVPLKEQQVKWRHARNGFPKDVLAEEERKVHVSTRRLEEDLSQRRWLAGDSYSLADICTYAIAVSVPRLVPVALNEADHPHAWAWLKRIEDRPALKQVMANRPATAPAPARAPGVETAAA